MNNDADPKLVPRLITIVASIALLLSLPVDSQEPSSAPDRANEEASAQNHVLENLISQYLAQQTGLELTNITSVECNSTTCEVVFSGTEEDPQYVDAYSHLWHGLMRQQWEDFRPYSGVIGLREISPGAKEFVMGFAYMTYEDLSTDPLQASRQHAACAASWKRMAIDAESRGDEETAAGMGERVEQELASAARVVGPTEADRLAGQITEGPLFRECRQTSSQ